MSFIKKHNDYILFLLVILVLILLLIIITDIHVAWINRDLHHSALTDPKNLPL